MEARMVAAKLIRETHFFLSKRLLIVSLLFGAAVAIRLYHINEPPLDFHATRQYRSLLIARAYFLDGAQVAEWRQRVAAINQERQGILEPPLMELMVSRAYHVVGGEYLWVPKLISSVFWLIGGVFLYFIALRVGHADAAVFATAFYLFLPFSVMASRSFQPDPLMVMLLLASVWLILKNHEHPSPVALIVLAAVSAVTVLVKPVSLFVVMSAFVGLGVHRLGLRRFLLRRDSVVYIAVSALPTIGFYVYGILELGTLRNQAEASFVPRLLATPFFWKGWLKNIGDVVGFAAFVGALLGVTMLRGGPAKVLLISLWVGYALFCLAFNYHIATHDYYHLQLVPIVALSLIPVVAAIFGRIADAATKWTDNLAAWGVLVLALAIVVGLAVSRPIDSTARRKVLTAEEIGRLVNHSTETLVLSSDYGLPLEYHGELSVIPWPISSDFEWERLAGSTRPSVEDRFNALLAKYAPKYFIVLDLQDFAAQDGLQQLLVERYPVLAQSDDYIIFDLTNKPGSS